LIIFENKKKIDLKVKIKSRDSHNGDRVALGTVTAVIGFINE